MADFNRALPPSEESPPIIVTGSGEGPYSETKEPQKPETKEAQE